MVKIDNTIGKTTMIITTIEERDMLYKGNKIKVDDNTIVEMVKGKIVITDTRRPKKKE